MRLLILLAAAIPLWAASAGPAAACKYHGGEAAFESTSAFDVAAAMRDPANADVLLGRAAGVKPRGLAPFYRAMSRLQSLRDALEQAAQERAPERPSFSLFLVEGGLWTRYVLLRDDTVKVDIDTDGARGFETTVTTGEAVLTAIAAGRLTPGDAYARGLIVVDGAAGARGDIAVWLRDALAVTRERQAERQDAAPLPGVSAPLPTLLTGRRAPAAPADAPARD